MHLFEDELEDELQDDDDDGELEKLHRHLRQLEELLAFAHRILKRVKALAADLTD